MNDLVVDSHLATIVVDNKDTDRATAVVEAVGETAEEAALVKNRKALLDVTSLSHGDDAAVITDVEDTVLLEDRAKHVLDDNRGAGVADEGGLLMQLLGEEVNTEVAVLASLSRGGDADDLARTALQDQQVADPDVVAGDGDGVGNHVAGGDAARGGSEVGLAAGSRGSDLAVTDDDVFVDAVGAVLVVVLVVVVRASVDGVKNLVRGAVKSVAERVVVAVFVVISHVTLVLLTRSVDCSLAHVNFLVEGDGFTVRVPGLSWVLARVGCLGFPLAGLSVVFFRVGSGAVTELSLSCVEAAVKVVLVLTLVGTVLYVDLVVGVALVRFTVAEASVVSIDSCNVGTRQGTSIERRRVKRRDSGRR